MPEVLDSLVELPLGSHCLSFHASQSEAAEQAADFLSGAPPEQPSAYWVPEPSLVPYYSARLAERTPEHVGCVQFLSHEQVERVDGRLRPVPEVLDFVRAHPDGVTAAGETLSFYWTPPTIPDHLEYEAWFEAQPRDGSRFLCPYDLRKVPPSVAPEVMRRLGSHHSHVALSKSPEPAVRLLQLFVFEDAHKVPEQLHETLGWALGTGLIEFPARDPTFLLSPKGEEVVHAWSQLAVIGW